MKKLVEFRDKFIAFVVSLIIFISLTIFLYAIVLCMWYYSCRLFDMILGAVMTKYDRLFHGVLRDDTDRLEEGEVYLGLDDDGEIEFYYPYSRKDLEDIECEYKDEDEIFQNNLEDE